MRHRKLTYKWTTAYTIDIKSQTGLVVATITLGKKNKFNKELQEFAELICNANKVKQALTGLITAINPKISTNGKIGQYTTSDLDKYLIQALKVLDILSNPEEPNPNTESIPPITSRTK